MMETGTTQLDSVYSSAVNRLLCGGEGGRWETARLNCVDDIHIMLPSWSRGAVTSCQPCRHEEARAPLLSQTCNHAAQRPPPLTSSLREKRQGRVKAQGI